MNRRFIRLPLCVKAIRQRRGLITCTILLAYAILMAAGNARAQDDPPLPVDPTPLPQLLLAAERAMLADAKNPKKTVETYLKLSDTHLEAALAVIKNGDTSRAERELDIYNKIMAEVCKTIFSMQDGKRSLAKKLEQHIYKQLKTLESVERLFPGERVAFAEDAIKKAKQFRVQALNEAFAGGDVLKDPDTEKPPSNNLPDEDKSSQSAGPSEPLELNESRWLVSAKGEYDEENNRPYPTPASYSSTDSSPQIPGDYLTEEEDNHVREAQKSDERIKVFIKIADRRLAALTGAPAPAATDSKAQKKLEEETREWGALPNLSRTQLLRHYTRAIGEGMAKLEDAYERNPKSSAIPKALTALLDATNRHIQTLKSLEAGAKDEKELAALKDAIEQAETANQGARDGLKGK
ncbi:MAG TPA: hypothetical protein VLR90_15610 [Blastocatellia bacterium]|nr:hypothetical protein [Blastocatellia bacterium]